MGWSENHMTPSVIKQWRDLRKKDTVNLICKGNVFVMFREYILS